MYFYGPSLRCNMIGRKLFKGDDMLNMTPLQTEMVQPRPEPDLDHQPLLQQVVTCPPSSHGSSASAQYMDRCKSPTMFSHNALSGGATQCLSEEVPLKTIYSRDERREVY